MSVPGQLQAVRVTILDFIIGMFSNVVMDLAFPDLDKSKELWMLGLEILAQLAATVLLMREGRTIFSSLYGGIGDDPTGAIVLGTFINSQTHLMKKIVYLKDKIIKMVKEWFSIVPTPSANSAEDASEQVVQQ